MIAALAAASLPAASFYEQRLDDPKAVYVNAAGDGIVDDTAAIQQAIDKVQDTSREGVVFLLSGRYRVTNTIYIWPSIRVIGVGATRPVLLLAPNTPGYQDPVNEKLMVFFAGARTTPPRDANPGTFYSALSNVDIEIGDGNPGAIGVRAHYAQHCFLTHMDFRIGSGLAAIHEGGNVAEDVHFFGGRYAIWTRTPSPGWQFTVMDAKFEGQREAAIHEGAAGLTLIRPRFRDVPTAIEIEPGYPEELWMEDGRFEQISGPALIVSLENSARTQINMERVVCGGVPTFALFRESGRKVPGPAPIYNVKTFSHGLHFSDVGATPETRNIFDAVPLNAMPEPAPSDLPDLPARDTWVNVRSLGVKGDGTTDDTAALRAAIATHRTLYFPMGRYVVSDTIALKPDTVLVGLHPSATQIDLLDNTSAFQGVGSPKPLLEAPHGGTNIVTGIGLYTNGINPRAVAAKWMAGPHSMMNDVRFLGGHGTNRADGTRDNPYNNTHSADPDTRRRWDAQYPSLWVTGGGGGTFLDIWTPSTFAQAGMLISNTSTEGRVYGLSSEHHVRNEVQVHNAANWKIYALQTEEERGEGGFALPLEITDSSNITVANLFMYRVISSYQPFPWGVTVARSKNIRFRNLHCWSNSKVSFDDAVFDPVHNVEIRQREFAWLDITGATPPAQAPDPRVHKLAGGFFNISGGATGPAGDFYFVDAHWQRIYRWSATDRGLSIVSDSPVEPVNLAFDRAGNLMVVSYAGNGTVYTLHDGDIALLKPEPVTAHPGARIILPPSAWRLNAEALQKPAVLFVSPDGTTILPAGEDFIHGAVSWGIKSSALIRGFGLAPAIPGQPFYLTEESEVSTWRGTVQPDGSLVDLKPFVDQGGESVATGPDGNVYIAAGEIYVYNPAGKLIDTIRVPERPVQLVFGGKEGRTLFIAARTSLYAVNVGAHTR